MNDRLNLVNQIEPYLGKYFSIEHVKRQILRQTDDEIEEIDMQIQNEIQLGILPDPNAAIDPMTGMPMQGGAMPPGADQSAGGAPPASPDAGGGAAGGGLDAAFSNFISDSDYTKGKF